MRKAFDGIKNIPHPELSCEAAVPKDAQRQSSPSAHRLFPGSLEGRCPSLTQIPAFAGKIKKADTVENLLTESEH